MIDGASSLVAFRIVLQLLEGLLETLLDFFVILEMGEIVECEK